MSEKEPVRENQQPVLIEQTSKKYKAMRGGGILILIATGAGCFVSAMNANDGILAPRDGIETTLVIVGGIVGFSLYVVGSVMSWWHHG